MALPCVRDHILANEKAAHLAMLSFLVGFVLYFVLPLSAIAFSGYFLVNSAVWVWHELKHIGDPYWRR
jgi:hypothetical protein